MNLMNFELRAATSAERVLDNQHAVLPQILSVTLCNLGVGATFGESILHDLPRDSTVVTKTTCELLRVEQQDFRLIFESMQTTSTVQTNVQQQPSPTKKQLSPDHPNPAAPITE
uniref:Uncharacterized protein n=1 Tax=Anopheles albimanus TaxID=7167 RepID=A0A182FG45_ANOAL